MKILNFIVLLLISFKTLSQEYFIERLDNDSFVHFTFEEMKQKLGENSVLIPKYRCNEHDELDPLHPPPRRNPLRDSLKIRSFYKEGVFTYQMGRVYDAEGEEVHKFKDPYLKKVVRALRSLEEIAPARTLLRYLEESYFPLEINKGGNTFRAHPLGDKEDKTRFGDGHAIAFLRTQKMLDFFLLEDIGTGGTLYWNPDKIQHVIESDNKKRIADPRIILAHELYHVFDYIRGLLDSGFVKGEDFAYESIYEYRGIYFENLVRKAFGKRLRKYRKEPYKEGLPDMLTPEGGPIYIPAPCLK